MQLRASNHSKEYSTATAHASTSFTLASIPCSLKLSGVSKKASHAVHECMHKGPVGIEGKGELVVDDGSEATEVEGLEMPRNLRSNSTDPVAEICEERERFEECDACRRS